MKRTKEKRAWRFTALDLIIFVVVLAVVGVAIYFFGPFRDGKSGDEKKVTLEYTIEIKNLEEQYLGNIHVGETVIDSVTKSQIGTVSAVEVMPMIEYIINTDDGVIEEKEPPGLYTLLLTISSPATYNAHGFNIEGYRVAIGALNHLQLPSFVGSGYCIGLETVN